MSTQGSLATFFSQYSDSEDFHYDSTQPATSEFYRLCDHLDWGRGDDERGSAHCDFKDALTQQFNANYGTDSEDLTAWQNLCTRLNIQPVPNTLERCRRVVTNTHVNLVDLVDGFENPDQTITIFKTVRALADYTVETGKYFPKTNAYAGALLKYLLRQILNPPSERRGHTSRGGKSRGGRSSGRRRRGGD